MRWFSDPPLALLIGTSAKRVKEKGAPSLKHPFARVFTTGLNHVTSFGEFAVAGWTPTLRSTLMASYQNAKYSSGFQVGAFDAYNDEAWSVAGNLFWSPIKGFDLGVEYQHGERILVSGASGQLNRSEFAAKYSF